VRRRSSVGCKSGEPDGEGAPPGEPRSSTILDAKFGLSFAIVDRDYLATLRRERGYSASPWASGSRFIISHSLMADETYVGGLRDLLGNFRPRALLILDEAHHAAPASGSRYAVDSQFTRAVRGLAERFEHRLFLSATPHNGHSNSFSALLEILDPQRFTRGVPVKPRDLDPVMVRRLKSDLRHFGETFPERKVEPIHISGLPSNTPELVLSQMLAAYGEAVRARTANLPPKEAGYDLIHIDLPWNPARLEQRNGRIDRKLQPSKEVWCRYFVYEQRPEDVVLQALVRKTERIRDQLGSAGQVIGFRLSERLEREGIWRAQALAREIDEEADESLQTTAIAEMDDETLARRGRQAKELDDLRDTLEKSRVRVGVDPELLHAVVAKAMSRAGTSLDAVRVSDFNGIALYQLNPSDPAFVGGGWPDALDDLRVRRRKRNERLKDWRATAPLRAISFRPATTKEGADAEGVLQVHLEHRLVRRLLSRFLSQGFASGLSRASVVIGPGAHVHEGGQAIVGAVNSRSSQDGFK
jgi:hypothetical protein